MMKKYLLFFAAFALLVVGCAQNEVVENRSESNAIAFRNLNDKITKAANDNNDNYGVFAAWSKLGNGTGADGLWFMAGVEVDGTDNSYSPTQYWPHEGTVTFHAYAPYGKLGSTDLPPYITAVYSVPAGNPAANPFEHGAHEDFTMATSVTVDTEDDDFDGTEEVSLVFNHMLSKITVNAVLDQSLIDVGYSLEFAHASAELKVKHSIAEVYLQDPSGGLTNGKTAATYNNIFTLDDADELVPPHFMIIPQPSWKTGEGSQVSIQLKGIQIYHNVNTLYWGGTNGSDMKVYNFTDEALNAENMFKANNHYAVTFTIKSGAADGSGDPVFGDAITFSSSLADWDSAGNNIPVTQP